MATIVKPTFWGETWNWQDDDYVQGDAVKCDVCSYRGEDRTFVKGEIAPNENHGWTTAASDYYYLILEGSATIEISDSESYSADHQSEISADDSKTGKGAGFLIKAGTTYNYRAGADGLKFVLFMNNLWEE